MTLVSALVPVFNAERFLADALDSIFAQGWKSLEVVVVDDGSTDGSADIARSYPVRYVRQANAGIAAARNAAIAAADGEILGFLDADDLWEPRKLARQMAALAAEPAPDFVLGHVRQFVDPRLDQEAAARIVCPAGLQPGYLPGAMLARRETFERVGPFREELRVGEFVDWMARARELGLREAMLRQHVLSRRLHDTNQSLKRQAATSDFARVVKASLDRRRAAAAAREGGSAAGVQ